MWRTLPPFCLCTVFSLFPSEGSWFIHWWNTACVSIINTVNNTIQSLNFFSKVTYCSFMYLCRVSRWAVVFSRDAAVGQSRIHVSPEELRTNRKSLQTEWWTAERPSLLVSWMLQQDDVCGSASVCCHCSCSSQSQLSSTRQRPAANDNTHTDCSSHTPGNTDTSCSVIIFLTGCTWW